MEDFQAAFFQRRLDVEMLRAKQRYTASMHFGGVAIECLLKAMICDTLPLNASGKKEWKTEDNDPGHTTHNPGHNCQYAVRCHTRLKERLDHVGNTYIWNMLDKIEFPGGHFIDTSYMGEAGHFIHMRYVGKEPSKAAYDTWYNTYYDLIKKLQYFQSN